METPAYKFLHIEKWNTGLYHKYSWNSNKSFSEWGVLCVLWRLSKGIRCLFHLSKHAKLLIFNAGKTGMRNTLFAPMLQYLNLRQITIFMSHTVLFVCLNWNSSKVKSVNLEPDSEYVKIPNMLIRIVYSSSIALDGLYLHRSFPKKVNKYNDKNSVNCYSVRGLFLSKGVNIMGDGEVFTLNQTYWRGRLLSWGLAQTFLSWCQSLSFLSKLFCIETVERTL